MPTYSYNCDNCQLFFELYFSISEYKEHPKCPSCLSKKTNRDYSVDLITLASSVKKADSELKTIGDLANRNRDRMSEDQKAELYRKHNDYKENKIEERPLPSGMTRMKKGVKTQWPT